MLLRVMSYNLLYAFQERDGGVLSRRPEREAAARDVVAVEQPDILALTEAAYCAAPDRFERPDYQTLFHLPYLAVGGYAGDFGHCLLSRYPIRSTEQLPLGKSPGGVMTSALRCVLDCEGTDVHVDVVHPSPHVTEAERVAGMAPLLDTAKRPHVLLGDFNALSDEDPYDVATMVAQMAGHVSRPEALAHRMLDRQLISSIRARGLRDTMPVDRRLHTIPTQLPRPHATQGVRLRIDYIFASSEFSVAHAEVVQRAPADDASDHYPVVAHLVL